MPLVKATPSLSHSGRGGYARVGWPLMSLLTVVTPGHVELYYTTQNFYFVTLAIFSGQIHLFLIKQPRCVRKDVIGPLIATFSLLNKRINFHMIK